MKCGSAMQRLGYDYSVICSNRVQLYDRSFFSILCIPGSSTIPPAFWLQQFSTYRPKSETLEAQSNTHAAVDARCSRLA